MTDPQRPFHDPQHPAVDSQRPWVEGAGDTEDQWAALATDNGRLLTEARLQLAAAETQRLAYAKQVAGATGALRKEHADQVAAVKHERDTALESLDKAYGWLTTACAARDEWAALVETQGAANRETLAALAEAADALDAATARERAAREALMPFVGLDAEGWCGVRDPYGGYGCGGYGGPGDPPPNYAPCRCPRRAARGALAGED